MSKLKLTKKVLATAVNDVQKEADFEPAPKTKKMSEEELKKWLTDAHLDLTPDDKLADETIAVFKAMDLSVDKKKSKKKAEKEEESEELSIQEINETGTTKELKELLKPHKEYKGLFKDKMSLKKRKAKAVGILNDQVEGEEEAEEVEETSTKADKKADKKKGKKKGARKSGPSSKGTIYQAWKKGKGEKDTKKLSKLVDGAVKESTIKSWLNNWAKGKRLPAGA